MWGKLMFTESQHCIRWRLFIKVDPKIHYVWNSSYVRGSVLEFNLVVADLSFIYVASRVRMCYFCIYDIGFRFSLSLIILFTPIFIPGPWIFTTWFWKYITLRHSKWCLELMSIISGKKYCVKTRPFFGLLYFIFGSRFGFLENGLISMLEELIFEIEATNVEEFRTFFSDTNLVDQAIAPKIYFDFLPRSIRLKIQLIISCCWIEWIIKLLFHCYFNGHKGKFTTNKVLTMKRLQGVYMLDAESI